MSTTDQRWVVAASSGGEGPLTGPGKTGPGGKQDCFVQTLLTLQVSSLTSSP